jgi:hypothetical protein
MRCRHSHGKIWVSEQRNVPKNTTFTFSAGFQTHDGIIPFTESTHTCRSLVNIAVVGAYPLTLIERLQQLPTPCIPIRKPFITMSHDWGQVVTVRHGETRASTVEPFYPSGLD